jgi:HEAT repeat protein
MWKAATTPVRLAVIAAAVASSVAWLLWNREPRYRGVPASEHIMDLIVPTSLPRSSPVDGIHEMGSELAVPGLIRVIDSEDSAWSRWYPVVHSKTPADLRKLLPTPSDSDRIVATAFFALVQFGPQAADGLPALMRLNARHRRWTISVFSAIGPAASNAIPLLVGELHPTNAHCFPAASALWRIDRRGNLTAEAFARHPARDTLGNAILDFGLQSLTPPRRSTDASHRWIVLELLGCVRSEAKHTAPVVVTYLQDENERVRAKALEVLLRFGPIARENAEAIRPLLHDNWRTVREAATNALKAIESTPP